MKEITLREHMSNAGKARQAKLTPEERKAHSAMMNAKRWPNGPKKKGTLENPVENSDGKKSGSTGKKEKPAA
jgi:hypothetical protein